MYFNNLNGCARICEDISWEIDDCKECIKIKGIKGKYRTKNECMDALVKECNRYTCAEGKGCTIDNIGEYKNYSACIDGCTLWDCSSGKCVRTKKGNYNKQSICEENLGYDSSNGCQKKICKGEYGNNLNLCMSESMSWKCDLGKGCSIHFGKNKGNEYFKTQHECQTSCIGYTCQSNIGCAKDPTKTSSKTIDECKASCTLYSCQGPEGQKSCKAYSKGYNNINECEHHCQNPATYNCVNGSCQKAEDGKGNFPSHQECSNNCFPSYSCIEGKGCIQIQGGRYKGSNAHGDCITGCSLWDCSNGNCSKTIDGKYSLKSDCTSNTGYDCSNACREKICGGNYSTQQECLNDCKPFKCDGIGKGCSRYEGKNTINGFSLEYECEKACIGYSCQKGIGCSTDPGSTTSKAECEKSCILYSCNKGNGKCTEDAKGLHLDKGLCEQHCKNPLTYNLTYNCKGGECIEVEDGTGQFNSLTACHSDCHKITYNCVKGVGCKEIENDKGEFNTHDECVKGCDLYNCSNGGCIKSSHGDYFKTECLNKLGYSCSNGCSELVCKGEYNHKAACYKACKSWKCTLGSGCEVVDGMNEGIGYYGSKSECNSECYGYTCMKLKGCTIDYTSSKTEEECKASCKLYSCKGGECIEESNGVHTEKSKCEEHCQNPSTYNCIGGECKPVSDGTGEYPNIDECLKECHKYACHPTGCEIDDDNGNEKSQCETTCKSWVFEDCNTGCVEKSGNIGTATKAECIANNYSWVCGENGCEYKCDSSGYGTKSECIDKCKSWFCEATGCEEKGVSGGSETKTACNENCKFSCGTTAGCVRDDNGKFIGVDDCKTNCPNYQCTHDGENNTCVKSIYGKYTTQSDCAKACVQNFEQVRYPKNANGVWFIGDNYSFDIFHTMSETDFKNEYGWLFSPKINVISLAFANPLSILTGQAGRKGENVDEYGLPKGMKKVINWLNTDNTTTCNKKGTGNIRTVMIVVGGWNNSVCSSKGGNCDKGSPCYQCYTKGGCNCDEYTLGPCKDVAGYCSGNACCSITSFAGPWPVIPDNQSGEDSYQALVPDAATYKATKSDDQNKYDQFGGIKICSMSVDGCKADDCQDFWYKAFTNSSSAATDLGNKFATIAKELGVGFEIDYEPQCGWGKCVYCNDHGSGVLPCSDADDGVSSYTCTDSASTIPFMQSLVNGYHDTLKGEKGTGIFVGDDCYQPGPIFPLTLDCGGGAYWLTDIFEFGKDNIYGHNYNNNTDTIKNYLTLINIMVDSVPLGSMNKAISCSSDMNCSDNHVCDLAALAMTWIWAPHFIEKDQMTSTNIFLNNVKTCHGQDFSSLKALEGKKVLNADNEIWEGYYTTPGSPQGFSIINSERTAISFFAGNGPSLPSIWDSVYDNHGCGFEPKKVPPTIEAVLNLLSKTNEEGKHIFYDSTAPYTTTGKIGGIMYWGAGKAHDGSIYGASDTIKGGSDVCATIEASYDALHTKASKGYQCNEECIACNRILLKSDCYCEKGKGCKINTDFWKPFDIDKAKDEDKKLIENIELITYACGTGNCGHWSIDNSCKSAELLNACTQIINPWVTTIRQSNCEKSDVNACYSKGPEDGGICYPTDMTTFLNTDLKDAIADPNWNGKTILSLGGWAEGYTFVQGDLTDKAYKASAKGPVTWIYPCLGSDKEICSDHPSKKLPGHSDWGYWCFKGDEPIDTKAGLDQPPNVGKPEVCDSGTGNIPPENCWGWLNSKSVLEKYFIKYAYDNGYTGVDVDYEPNGNVENQPFNSWYMRTVSVLAKEKGISETNQTLDITMAPLQNFFLDNKEWNYVEYDYSDIKADIPFSTTSKKGYTCEGPGGYGNMLFNLYKNGIDLYSIFIQFYNNPPTICDASENASDYCVECGSLGAVENFGGDEINKGGPREGGKYYTIGPACGGGDIFDGSDMIHKVQQCNYEEDKGTWAWQKAGYHYGGSVDPKLKGSFCGDPMGYYAKNDNPWLNTTKAGDEPWLINSIVKKSTDGLKGEPIKLGGVYNTILIMLMAKCYQPNAIIAYGTVPPSGGNCGNLSATMVIDLYKYLLSLQYEIRNEICNNGRSNILCYLMTQLINNSRLKLMPDSDTDYWNKNWGGPPNNKNKFCSKYPGYPDQLIFNGIGAWSTFWTEISPGSSDTSNWIKTIKDGLNIKGLTPTELNKYCNKSDDTPSSGVKAYKVQTGDIGCENIINKLCGSGTGNKYKQIVCNGENVCNGLPVGSVIHYNCDKDLSECPPTKGTYTVKSGDTCSDIVGSLCGNSSKAKQKICNNSCINIQPGHELIYDCNGCANGGGSNG